MQSYKLQTAMEYLMTYGWALLIIAGILVALWQLVGLASRQVGTPQSCQVVRLNGPNTSQLVSLRGLCNGTFPQTVAQFNGQGQYVNFGNSALFSPQAGVTGAMTLCMWYMPTSLVGWVGPTLKGEGVPTYGNAWEYTFDQGGGVQGFTVWISTGVNKAAYAAAAKAAVNTWYFACMTYNYPASNAFYYLNGVQYPAAWFGGVPAAGTGNFIVGGGESSYSKVMISNVQMYNASLPANTIKSLYREGIGGAPITLQNLVGWWPLNGNANDYSGDMLNGVANSMSFTSSWSQYYKVPSS